MQTIYDIYNRHVLSKVEKLLEQSIKVSTTILVVVIFVLCESITYLNMISFYIKSHHSAISGWLGQWRENEEHSGNIARKYIIRRATVARRKRPACRTRFVFLVGSPEHAVMSQDCNYRKGR